MDLEITNYPLRGWFYLTCRMSCEEKSLRHHKYLSGVPVTVRASPHGPIKECNSITLKTGTNCTGGSGPTEERLPSGFETLGLIKSTPGQGWGGDENYVRHKLVCWSLLLLSSR